MILSITIEPWWVDGSLVLLPNWNYDGFTIIWTVRNIVIVVVMGFKIQDI